MSDSGVTGRAVGWYLITTIVLVIRVIATLGTAFFAIAWIIAALRDTLINPWLWWLLGFAGALLLSTYIYSYLRARYPRRNDWIP